MSSVEADPLADALGAEPPLLQPETRRPAVPSPVAKMRSRRLVSIPGA